MSPPSNDQDRFLLLQARHVRQCWKESIFVAIVWFISLGYCTVVFSNMGYIPLDARPEIPQMIWGIPAWVFWGLFVPWVVLIVVTWLFAAFVMEDDEPFVPLPGRHSDADSLIGNATDAAGRD